MQDWSKYIEQNYNEDALPRLLAEGYQLEKDDWGAYGHRNAVLKKDDITIEVVCCCDIEEYERMDKAEDVFGLDDFDWWVLDIFENGESYNEFSDSEWLG